MENKDEELIIRSLNQDHEAYAQLVDRYKNALYYHCFAIVRDEDTAEDMAQDTFITAYYKLDKYDNKYRFATWLFKIATNKSLNWLKSAARQIQADDQTLTQIASGKPGPEEKFRDTELQSAVGKLKPEFRAVISLYYWQGLTYQEIATVLAVPSGSVKGWMYRAKEELRKELS